MEQMDDFWVRIYLKIDTLDKNGCILYSFWAFSSVKAISLHQTNEWRTNDEKDVISVGNKYHPDFLCSSIAMGIGLGGEFQRRGIGYYCMEYDSSR